MRALFLAAALLLPGDPAAQDQGPATITSGRVLLMAAGTQIDVNLLAAALAHDDPRVRGAAARVISVFAVTALADVVAAALAKENDELAGTELARALLFLRGDQSAGIVESHAQRIGKGAATALQRWRERQTAKPAASMMPDEMFSRVVPSWQPGLLSTLSAAAGCRLEDGQQFGYARLTYRRDGRPLEVAIDRAKLSKQCTLVLTALGRLTLADDADRIEQGHRQWIVVPFSKTYAECTEYLDPPLDREAKPLRITPPKKIKDVRPTYPDDMRAKRIQGLVAAQGVISTRGCLTDLRITQSPALGLELAALRAMSGWVFEPAKSAGRPFPTTLTLTTSFSVR